MCDDLFVWYWNHTPIAFTTKSRTLRIVSMVASVETIVGRSMDNVY